MFAGVPFAPISPAYSTVSQDYGKLRHILGVLTPGLVFASLGERLRPRHPGGGAGRHAGGAGAGRIEGRHTLAFDELLARPATAAVDAAHAKVGPDSIASSSSPRARPSCPGGVINTQRMLCANQQQILQCFPGLGQVRPVLVDWLPWNHTFGGNHNVGLTIYNGGTLYIDEGKPTPALIHETLRNLREISPTVYFNVPKRASRRSPTRWRATLLRDSLFARVNMFFFAGAGLSSRCGTSSTASPKATCGERIRMLTGLGMTETAPFAGVRQRRRGEVGPHRPPAPGMELKLVPSGDKTGGRYRGPNVTGLLARARADARVLRRGRLLLQR